MPLNQLFKALKIHAKINQENLPKNYVFLLFYTLQTKENYLMKEPVACVIYQIHTGVL